MDWRLENICVYCGNPADTLDHVPSKCFLDKPYPNNLIAVQCCKECNHRFSSDEEYVSCFIDCMKEKTTNPDMIKRKKTRETLLHSDKLLKRIKDQFRTFADIVVWGWERKRFELVMYKLAFGHLAQENNYINWDSDYKVNMWLLGTMSQTSLEEFEKPYFGDIAPEIGSNNLAKNGHLYVYVGIDKSFFYYDWVLTQEGRYRYCISPDNTKVKFVIAEYLAVEVLIIN